MPAKRCQSYNQKGNQCRLTTKQGDFCWRHVLKPSPIPSYQSATPAAPAPHPSVHANISQAQTTTPQVSSEDTRETSPVRGKSSGFNHGISVSENVAPAVVITTKVEGLAGPALYQIREIGADGPRRARTWRSWVPRPLRPSGSSTPRGSNLTIQSNQLQPEHIIRGMGFSPKTQRALIAYLNKTREVKEELYIACSPQNPQGERRIKIGRTADPNHRVYDYKKCGMEIVWSMHLEHTNRLEKLILMAMKLDFQELGQQSGNSFVQEIRVLGRKVVCPCGKSHNDMFHTTGNWDDTHLDELKNLIFEFSKLDRLECENLFEVEVDEPLEKGAGGEKEQTQGGDGVGETQTAVRAKSEERAAEIHAELVKAQRPWVRGVDGRLIRTN
ncbi:hypothetical protein BGX38DRAFT_1222413 [Terfezia claveryi]|nr:hypothetical protein BGX38DRAFT_1222413 [Terfezia claveryi]